MAYDLISFDLDGTLVDTAGEIAAAANLALTAHGLAQRPVPEITDLIGAGTRQLMLGLLARCALERPSSMQAIDPKAVLASFDAHYARTTGSSAMPYEGCQEALAKLRGAGVRLACTTNKELRHAHRVLAATALEGHFHLVIGGDSLPEKKPHGSVLRHVAARLGADLTRVAHVGDSSIDIESARQSGVAAWAVAYGYNGGVPFAQAAPDHIFQCLTDVADHVIQSRAQEARLQGPARTSSLSEASG